MRLFTALALPDKLAHRLAALGTGNSGLRPMTAEQLHVTLVFIGEVNPRDLTPIEDALTLVEPPPLELEAQGLFDSRSGALGLLVKPSVELLGLQRKIHQALAQIDGLRLERRRYKPHLTLARYRSQQPPQLGQWVAEQQRLSYHWRVDRFGLYSSQLHPEGARYRLEAEFCRPPSLRPRRRST